MTATSSARLLDQVCEELGWHVETLTGLHYAVPAALRARIAADLPAPDTPAEDLHAALTRMLAEVLTDVCAEHAPMLSMPVLDAARGMAWRVVGQPVA